MARWTPQADPENEGAADTPYRTGGMEPRYLMARLNEPNSHMIKTYEADGGYETARRVLSEVEPADMVEQIKASGIRGRGGAGFPTGIKWGFLPQGVFPRYLVVNADESEPGTFKDRIIMEYDPHQLIEGIILSAHAIESEKAFIYIRGEYYFAYTRMEAALAEATAEGLSRRRRVRQWQEAGRGAAPRRRRVRVRRGDGAAFEPGGLPGAAAAQAPLPGGRGAVCQADDRQQRGVDLQRHARDAFTAWSGTKEFGTERSPGMRIFCLSGNVKRPGLYELPHATPLSELVDEYGGGPQDEGSAIKAIVPGGLSMKLLKPDQFDTPLDFESVTEAGSLLGSAGVIAIDERTSMVEVARRTLGFLSRGELRQVHALPRGHGLAGEDPAADRRRAGPGQGLGADGVYRRQHRGQELLPVRRGVGVGFAEQSAEVPGGVQRADRELEPGRSGA